MHKETAGMVAPSQIFNQLVLFKDLSASRIELLRSLFMPCFYSAGDVIFEQGDPADSLYLVISGEVVVRYKPEDGPALVVARVHPQGVVGWSAALGSPSYTSTALCSTPTQMISVRGEDLRALCLQDPETGALVLERLAAVIAERLRNTHEHVLALLEQGLGVSVHSA